MIFSRVRPKLSDGLVRQAVDQVHVDGTETERARLLEHGEGFGLALNPVHRLLHRGLEILHAHAQTIEAETAQHRQRLRTDLARVHLDAVFTLVVITQAEMLTRDVHQLPHFIMTDEGRRAAAPVQLLHRARAVEQFRLQGDLAMQPPQIRRGALAVLGDDLVAGAVETDGVAERQMKIQRQRTRGRSLIAAFGLVAVIRLGETRMELHCRRIRGVARSALVVAAQQFGVKNDLVIQAMVLREVREDIRLNIALTG